MAVFKVDPIKYAWDLCNPGAQLPPQLKRVIFRDSVAASPEAEFAASRRAAHSDIIRRRGTASEARKVTLSFPLARAVP